MTSVEVVRETPCFDIESPTKATKRARLDESGTVKCTAIDNDVDKSQSPAAVATSVESVVVKKSVREPKMMFMIQFIPEDQSEWPDAYIAPLDCKSVRHIKLQLPKIFELQDSTTPPVTNTMLEYLRNRLQSTPNTGDEDDPEFAFVYEEKIDDHFVDHELHFGKIIDAEEHKLWQIKRGDAFSSIESNPEFVYQICVIKGTN